MGLGQRLDEELGEGTLTGLLWTQIHTVGETTYGGDTELVGGDAYIHEEICGLREEVHLYEPARQIADHLVAACAWWRQLLEIVVYAERRDRPHLVGAAVAGVCARSVVTNSDDLFHTVLRICSRSNERGKSIAPGLMVLSSVPGCHT